MPLVLADRVRETTTVVGTNDATLLGAVTGFQSFAVVGNTNTCYYTIADNAGNWEVGIGTYSTTGPTLARTTVLSSSNAGLKVNFPAGTKDIFVTYPSEKSINLDESGYVDAGGSPNVSLNGNLTFIGTTRRITGDFSNATLANRVMFQTSTTNGRTVISAIPNGTGTGGNFISYNTSDPANSGFLGVYTTNTLATIDSGITGTGTYLPLTMLIGGSERLRIDTSGNLLLGTSTSPAATVSPPAVASGTLNIGGAPAFYTFNSTASATTTQYASLFLQNATPFVATGSGNTQTAAVSINPQYSHDASVGTAQISARGIASQPLLISTAATANVQYTSAALNAQRHSSTDLSQLVGIEGVRTNFGHTTTLASTAISPNAIGFLANGNIQTGSVTGSYIGAQINTNATPTTGLTATISNLFGIQHNAAIGTSTGTVTVTNYYGLYLTAPNTTPNGTITNRWGIYQADTTGSNYFGANVGIGTTTPSQKLNVSGGSLFAQGASDWFGIRGNSQNIPPSDDGTNAVLAINGNYSNGGAEINFWNTNQTLAAGFRFMSKTGASTFNDVMYMRGNDGNVGINQLNPSSALHITRSGATETATKYTNGNAASGYVVGVNTSGSGLVYHIDNQPIIFATNNSERMRILADGKVGIGASGPLANLSIGTNGNATATPTALLAYNATGLGGTTDNMAYISEFGGNTGNNLRLLFALRRTATGSDWNTAAWRIQPAVDGSFTAAGSNRGYLELAFGASGAYSGVGISGNGGTSPDVVVNTSGNVGIGTSSPSVRLDVGGGGEIRSTDSTVQTFMQSSSGGGGGFIGTRSNHYLQFRTNDANRMIITAAGDVGIGTSSPGARLQVAGTSGTPQFLAGTSANAISLNVNNSGSIYLTSSVTNSTDFTIGTASSIPFVFFTNNSERMRILSTGEVSIGTQNNIAKLGVFGGALGTNQGDQIMIEKNWSTAGNALFLEVSEIRTSAGSSWTTTGSRIQRKVDSTWHSYIQFGGTGIDEGMSFGTGGNTTSAISTVERMRITNTGVVGIGTTNPDGSAKLDVAGNIVLTGQSTADQFIRVGSGRTGNGYSFIDLQGDTTYSNGLRLIRTNSGANSASNIEHRGTGGLQMVTQEAAPIVFYTTATERMRITSGGNVGIGTSSPSYKTSIVYTNSAGGVNETGLYLRNTSTSNSTQMLFDGNRSWSLLVQGSLGSPAGAFTIQDNTAGSNRLSITSGGDLLVAKTALGGSNAGLQVPPGNSSMVYSNLSTSSSTDGLFACWSNNSTTEEKFIVRANGDCNNRNGTYSAYSDIRLKENVVNARSYINDLCKLRVVNYNFISDADKTKYLGFVAQEVEQIMPNLVAVAPTEDLPDAKTVKLTVMIPMLVQAIQEQQKMIEELTNRIKKLEGV